MTSSTVASHKSSIWALHDKYKRPSGKCCGSATNLKKIKFGNVGHFKHAHYYQYRLLPFWNFLYAHNKTGTIFLQSKSMFPNLRDEYIFPLIIAFQKFELYFMYNKTCFKQCKQRDNLLLLKVWYRYCRHWVANFKKITRQVV
jgi:hypothetical protein